MEYLLRRQRKAILQNCRRIAIVGASTDPDDASYVSTEKLLGLGLEIAPVLPRCERYLGFPCYARLRDVPGRIDVVQVYPRAGTALEALARETVAVGAHGFWIEEGAADPTAKEILATGRVQVFEHESLEREYGKHLFPPGPAPAAISVSHPIDRVEQHMTRRPVTVRPTDGIEEAMAKMKAGRFRHLPVVDDEGKLTAMLSDRDIRMIHPSLAFVSLEDAALQLASTAVRQAAMFEPITIHPNASLAQAAELMLRWGVGGLPVVSEADVLAGIITYTDILRSFVARA
jgi:predicted CoA-binding protein/predicted transcriptional regulator